MLPKNGIIAKKKNKTRKKWETIKEGELSINCGIDTVKFITSKKGNKLCFLTCFARTSENEDVTVDITVFGDNVSKFEDMLRSGNLATFYVKPSTYGEDTKFKYVFQDIKLTDISNSY